MIAKKGGPKFGEPFFQPVFKMEIHLFRKRKYFLNSIAKILLLAYLYVIMKAKITAMEVKKYENAQPY